MLPRIRNSCAKARRSRFHAPDRSSSAPTASMPARCARALRPLYLLETPIVSRRSETAELIKYAAKAFLATKITFITGRRSVRGGRRRCPGTSRAASGSTAASAASSCTPARLRRVVLSEGLPGAGADCGRGRDAAGDATPCCASTGAQAPMAKRITGGVRRYGRRQDAGRAGSDLQAEYRRHARQPGLTFPAGLCDAGARIRAFDPEGMGRRKS